MYVKYETLDLPEVKSEGKYKKTFRKWIWSNQNRLCFWCNRITVLPNEEKYRPGNSATLDHVLPRCKGGTWNLNNLVVACRVCNESRGCLGLMEWLKPTMKNKKNKKMLMKKMKKITSKMKKRKKS